MLSKGTGNGTSAALLRGYLQIIKCHYHQPFLAIRAFWPPQPPRAWAAAPPAAQKTRRPPARARRPGPAAAAVQQAPVRYSALRCIDPDIKTHADVATPQHDS